MSPALAAGDAEDTRCDIYSFGALLYEMLTGHPPYEGQGTREILNQILAGPPKPILSWQPGADRGLVSVAEKAMARELRNRYADMRDVVADLQQIRQGKAPDLPPAGNRVWKYAWIPVAIVGVAWLGWELGTRHAEPGVPIPAKPAPPTPVASAPPVAPAPVVPVPPAPVAPAPASPRIASPVFGQPGVGGYADGAGVRAQFRLPNAVAADLAGNLYVADTGNQVIRKIAPDGVVSTLAGMAGVSGSADGLGDQARFQAPFGLAVDREGNVYVADTINNTIRKIFPDGVVQTLAGRAGQAGDDDGVGDAARFRNPWGVAVDPWGNVFVADMSNDAIRKISPTGRVTTLAGLAGSSGQMDGAGGRARFNRPFGVAVDPRGNLYVSDSGNQAIRRITPEGEVVTLAGRPGQAGYADGSRSDARFNDPEGLAVDASGNLYVADTGNNLVRKITPLGMVSTLKVGTDGPRLKSPGDVAVDGAGNLYVADTCCHIVCKMPLPGW
jgi:sugar lactone lactonase YvrE